MLIAVIIITLIAFILWLCWPTITASLCKRLVSLGRARDPDFTIWRGEGDDRHAYLQRWWVIPRNRLFNIYLHRFSDDDDDRALHDHPWFNCSILLRGAYIEHTIAAGGVEHKRTRTAGAVKFRAPWNAHRISLIERPTWTLFITGPVIRTWGFHCPKGWRPWKQFVDARDHGAVGKGCAE